MVSIFYSNDGSYKEIENYILICDYYGIECRKICLGNLCNGTEEIKAEIKEKRPEAIIISKEVLQLIDTELIYSHIEGISGYLPSIFYPNLTSKLNDVIGIASIGMLHSIETDADKNDIRYLEICDDQGKVDALSGIKVPVSELTKLNLNYLKIDEQFENEVIFNLRSCTDLLPIYFSASYKKITLYFNSKIEFKADYKPENILVKTKCIILEHFQFIIMLKKTFGKRMWHYPKISANLTIDDPWLRDSYGYLNYEKLLQEMKLINFHTTIAFIPWNYDRNKKNIVDVFKKNSSYYSVSYHGNNHDKREFYRYLDNKKNKYPAKPIKLQEYNIKQALSRMAKMKELTDIEIDKIMVFPHGIAPAKTLELLDKAGFLATVNVNNIPLDETEPDDFRFYFDVVSMEYCNFPSIRRFSDDVFRNPDKSWILQFLVYTGNPVFIHSHHNMFKSGMDNFNAIAKNVNKYKVKWDSLGNITKKLYKLKYANNDEYLVNVLSKEIVLENDNKSKKAYHIQKKDLCVEIITVDNKEVEFRKTQGVVCFRLFINPGEKKTIKFIGRLSNTEENVVGIKRNYLRGNILRIACDIRDNYHLLLLTERIKKLREKAR